MSALGPEGVEPLFTLDGTETQAFDGTEEFFLICADAEAAYGLDETGGKTPLIVWADCAVESSAPARPRPAWGRGLYDAQRRRPEPP